MTYATEIMLLVALAGVGLLLRFWITPADRSEAARRRNEKLDRMNDLIVWESAPTGSTMALLPGPDYCAAAETAAGRFYRPGREPAVPLQDCDNPERCACRYQRQPGKPQA